MFVSANKTHEGRLDNHSNTPLPLILLSHPVPIALSMWRWAACSCVPHHPLLVRTIKTIVRRWGDPNILPFLNTILVFMNHMTRYPVAMSHLEKIFPWESMSPILHSLLNSGKPGYKVQCRFCQSEKHRLPRPLLEDFAMRGLLYSKDYFPND
jgi:hypothetical protein